MFAAPANPVYNVGDRVRYIDRNARPQVGKVKLIEAKWYGWTGESEPVIIYTVEHPTYRGKRFYAPLEWIQGLSNT